MFIILNDDHDDNDGCGGGGANYCVSVYICVACNICIYT